MPMGMKLRSSLIQETGSGAIRFAVGTLLRLSNAFPDAQLGGVIKRLRPCL